jgi:hypothetical protein
VTLAGGAREVAGFIREFARFSGRSGLPLPSLDSDAEAARAFGRKGETVFCLSNLLGLGRDAV